jgi:hypothetical protein
LSFWGSPIFEYFLKGEVNIGVLNSEIGITVSLAKCPIARKSGGGEVVKRHGKKKHAEPKNFTAAKTRQGFESLHTYKLVVASYWTRPF